MLKGLKKTVVNVILLSLTIICLVTLSLLSVKFSSIFYILIGGVVGLTVYLISLCKKKVKKTEQESQQDKGDKE